MSNPSNLSMLLGNCSEATDAEYALLGDIDVLVGGYGTIGLATLGVCANILAILVLCKKSFKSNFNNLLIALAVFDLLFLVVSITESIRRTFEPRVTNSSTISGLVTQLHHHLFPYFLYPLHNILLTCSIFMTVSISIERYLAIFHPFVYQKRKCISSLSFHIIPVIILAVLINIPKFLESKVGFEDQTTWIEITDMRKSFEYTLYYQHWTRFLILGIIPLILLTFLNFRIVIHTKRSNSKERTYSTILLLIVAIFILCHMPKVALNFYEVLDIERIEQCGPPVWSLIFNVFSNGLLPALNCTINFFIYFLAGRKFRISLFKMCKYRNEQEGTVVSKFSEVGDKDDIWEGGKDATELKELESTKLLIK